MEKLILVEVIDAQEAVSQYCSYDANVFDS
jgi:hypothetical protein